MIGEGNDDIAAVEEVDEIVEGDDDTTVTVEAGGVGGKTSPLFSGTGRTG